MAAERDRREELDSVMATVAAGIAHEVRNPLNAVQINLRILEEEVRRLEPLPTAQVHTLLAKIGNEIRSLDNFVAEFLRFARPPKPRLETIAVRELLTDLVAFIGPESGRRRLTLALHADEGPATIAADPFQLKHALLNLVLNAFQACGTAGNVAIVTGGGADRLRIAVTDDGPGIPPDVLPRVFDAFFTTREGGTGLGLPITRRIAEEHGGSLVLACPPGGGTVATLELPVGGARTR
ncbi:MAG TPA: ATP-binding protein [Haliangiales bacterium]|nr:ATP-binding protein [Haliangiales bacterium]